jgi:NAD(P)-dependent dehydrogenase (short-subunit alcohol dehydrogenase family)
MNMLENQVAIITGSGRGVGRAAALMMAEHGARVVVSDMDEAPAEEVVEAIKQKGGQAISVNGDVTAPDFPKRIISETIKAFVTLDILVNNAGYTWDSTKDLIKSGGEWISSVDVENALMAHEAVFEATVVAVPHPTSVR